MPNVPEGVDYLKMASLMGKKVIVDRPNGKRVTASVCETHIEGFFGGYDASNGDRIVFYPKEVVEVILGPGERPGSDANLFCKECGHGDESACYMTDEETKDILDCRCQCHRKYNGLYCSVCDELQFDTPSGATCKNGHGGAEGKKDRHPF